MPHPFELTPADLESRLDEMVLVTIGDLQSQFLTLPRGDGFIDFPDFQQAYEVLKRRTNSFARFSELTVWESVCEDALGFVVLRTILGFSPPEWAELARSEKGSDVTQGAARQLDSKVRQDKEYFSKLQGRTRESVTLARSKALIAIAVECITRGVTDDNPAVIHRLGKMDTKNGLASLQNAANLHVPYAAVLYERYLGRPFASHRDAVSELVGDVMENAIENQLSTNRISHRRTGRAERIPGFEQAPDFFVPTEIAPSVIIEAKIIGDDGTARDKVSRILRLASMRDERERDGRPSFEVVACIDGRGFGVRRNDMRDMLKATRGKVFTLATLPRLIEFTDLRNFLPNP